MKAIPCAIALGSNLRSPIQQIREAAQALSQAMISTKPVVLSRLYKNPPVGDIPQSDFINGAALIWTALTPQALLKQLLRIEQTLGRVRDRRWGPRTIDMDIILYGDQIVSTPNLTIPHPRCLDRPFVVFPVLDVWPSATLPDGTPLSEVAETLDPASLQCIREKEIFDVAVPSESI